MIGQFQCHRGCARLVPLMLDDDSFGRERQFLMSKNPAVFCGSLAHRFSTMQGVWCQGRSGATLTSDPGMVSSALPVRTPSLSAASCAPSARTIVGHQVSFLRVFTWKKVSSSFSALTTPLSECVGVGEPPSLSPPRICTSSWISFLF